MNSFAAISVGVMNASFENLGNTKLDRAIQLVVSGRAVVEEAVDGKFISSVGGKSIPYPKIIRLLTYLKVPFTYSEEFFTKQGVLKRDNHTCGYCRKTSAEGAKLTHDHIIPSSRGGTNTWMNAITACTSCNGKKADRTPEEAEMPLLFQPTIPYKIYFNSGKKHKKTKW